MANVIFNRSYRIAFDIREFESHSDKPYKSLDIFETTLAELKSGHLCYMLKAVEFDRQLFFIRLPYSLEVLQTIW